MSAASIMQPEDVPALLESRQSQTPGSPVVQALVQVRNGSGELRWLEWRDRALFGPDGTIVEHQIVGRDITEEHERRRELLVKEAAIAASVDGIAIIDPDGRIEYANRAFATIFGYDAPWELIGLPHADLAHGDPGLSKTLPDLEMRIVLDGQWIGELGCFRRDGRPFQAHVSASVALDDGGRLLCILLSIVDVTERRLTEQALKLSREKLQEAIEFMPDAIFIVDHGREVVGWNRAMETMSGIGRDEVIGTRDYGRAFLRFGGAFPVLIDLLDLSTEELARTYPGVRRFGDTLYFEAPVPALRGGRGGHLWGKASPLMDRDGGDVGAIQTLRDISDWKRAEEAYRDAMQREHRSRRLEEESETVGT
jgi:PAS domain S-box-containing protein